MKTKAAFRGIIMTVLTLFALTGISYTAVMPAVQELQTISGLVSPTGVAVSSDKRIFVIEGDRNRIRIFSRNGSPAGSLYVTRPSAVAVSPSGKIYVGSREDLSVGIYTEGGERVGQLGSGENEFSNPYFIYFDSASSAVYVIDKNAGVIRKYSETGEFLGDVVNDAGNLPEAMTIYNNELYVIDSPPAVDATGKNYSSARVQVFDASGNAIRSFGSWGYDVGQFKNPAGITHDSEGRIYVADGNVGVLCFDGQSGQYLDMIYPLSAPMGIVMNVDNKLAVSTPGSRSAKVFGVGSFSNMVVGSGGLTFKATDLMPKPASQQITISNTGNIALVYTASSSAAWLGLQNTSSSIPPQGQAAITVAADGTGLNPGRYQDMITVSDDTGAIERIAVTLDVTTAPKMTVTPLSGLAYTYTIGSAVPLPGTLTITVVDDPDNTAQWNATASGGGWLGISPSSSTGNGVTTSQVTVDPAGLVAGLYQGTITISFSVISGAPVSVPVSLEVRGSVVANANAGKNIIVSPGKTTAGYAKIGIFDANGVKHFEFDPFGLKLKRGYNVASGDVDGDGSADIIVGMGNMNKLPARIAVFNRNGDAIPGTDITPLSTKNGAKVAAGHFIPNDARAAVIVSSGQGPRNAAQVKILIYDNGELKESGIDIVTFHTRYGVNAAAGDIDGDGTDELVVSPGPDPHAEAEVKVYDIDTTGGIGAWTAAERVVQVSAFPRKCGANVSAGDVNGDGRAEIIVSSGSCASEKPNTIAVIDGSGQEMIGFREASAGGMVTAVADVDMNGNSEIVAAPVKRGNNRAIVRVFSASDGVLLRAFIAYRNAVLGANIAVGELGWGVE